jgi:hypothetical protein
MLVMQVVHRRSFAFVLALLLVPSQLSQLVAQTNDETGIAAMGGNPNRQETTGYIGRMEPARKALTIILIPTEDNQITAYYGLAGNIPFSDVKIGMLDRIGVFPLEKPLSDGIFFENPYQRFTLARETDSHTPGSVLRGTVEFINGDDYTNITDFFEYKEPAGDGK